MKKQTIVAAALIGLVGLGFMCVRFLTLWPQLTVAPSSIVPTQPITTSTSIGGVAADTQKPVSPQTPTTTQPPPSAAPAPQPGPSVDSAPKQTEITKNITKEFPYQALATSNDPLTQTSWALSTTKAQAAWDQSTGTGVVVAVIDSGFALGHEDLVNQWHKNPAEMGMTVSADRCWTGTSVDKATNACDDDNNGYVDDWRGWDFVGRTNNPQAGRSNSSGQGVAHGTEVAGLVGATGNNGKGIATYGWNTRLLPLQVLSDDGSGYTSSIVAAIYYAVDNGANVINMSLGGPDPDPALEEAINYAYTHNVIVVAAAGNCGTGQEAGCDPAKPGAMGYPALNKHVLAVGASTSNNTRASFSSYGPGLDVVAPGSGAIASTMWTATNQTSAYASNLYGTSFASPLVAGYIALIKSVRPATTVDDITALVDGTAQKVSSMGGNVYMPEYGHGLIDAAQSLTIAAALSSTSAQPTLLQTGSERSEHGFSASSSLSSGCQTTRATYCTVWATDNNGFDRYLPYTQTGTSGAGWSWNGSALDSGVWWLLARSGTNVSPTPYLLMQK